jgi:hypothetical protein
MPFGPGSTTPGPGFFATFTRGTALASTWAYFGGDPSFYAEPTPPFLDDPAMTWDAAQAQVVFFRGSNGGTPTWTGVWTDSNPGWAGSGATSGLLWTPRPTAGAPSSVKGHRLASCAAAGGVVLFGGEDALGALLDETWLWNGTSWSLLAPAARPPARRSHVLFCDERREKVLLAGGAGAAGVLDDLWEFDGTTWRELFPAERPEARREAGGAFVSGRGEGVLFGGFGAGFLGDTWVVDGGRDRRPAHLFHASFAAAAAGEVQLRSVAATWDAMASSFFTVSAPSYSAQLHVRDGSRWALTDASNIGGAPLAWSTDTDAAWSGLDPAVRAARLRRLLGGDRLELSLAAVPLGTNGTLSPGASLDTTYVEAKVSYRLACLAPGAATTTPLRCCSGVASGAACQ